MLQHLTPVQREKHAVALGAGAPHSGALGHIEHAELDGRAVGNDATPTTQSIHLAHYLPLGHAAHGGIAGHLADGVEHLGDKQDTAAQPCSGSSGLGAGMTGTHNYYIVRFKHHRA